MTVSFNVTAINEMLRPQNRPRTLFGEWRYMSARTDVYGYQSVALRKPNMTRNVKAVARVNPEGGYLNQEANV